MIALFKRYLARRRLKPIVSVLPRRLVKSFGVGEHCTFLQAKRTISDLGLVKSVEPYAFAAVCRFRELQRSSVPLSAHDYRRLRTELAELFSLGSVDFTITDLIATAQGSHSPAHDSSFAGYNIPPGPGSGDASGTG